MHSMIARGVLGRDRDIFNSSMNQSEAKVAVDRQLEAGGVDDDARRQWILMNLKRDRDSETYREGFVVCGICRESADKHC